MVDSITSLKEVLEKLGKKPSKALSQNFLIDQNIINKIILLINPSEEDNILEIGPGPGALTKKLLNFCNNITAIEKDEIFAAHLQTFEKKLKVFEADILTFPLESIKTDKKIKVVGNLPYSITTPIITKLLFHYNFFSEMTFMVQYEMAKRIISTVDNKNYGPLTILINLLADISLCFKISPNAFFPKPKVNSAIIQIKIRKTKVTIDVEKFYQFLKTVFHQRRKKISVVLKNLFIKENMQENFISLLSKLNINPNFRPENLTADNYYSLYKNLYKN